MKIKFIALLASCLLTISQVYAQDYQELSETNMAAMSIPSSPAFSLLGVNPEIVTRPYDVKEFKVDWRIKNYKIAPDLALEAQPLWWAHYRNKTPKEFIKMSRLERILSTMTMSLATAKIDNVNHLAHACKFNIYKEYDPYQDFKLIESNEKARFKEIIPVDKEIEKLKEELKEQVNKDSIEIINEEIEILEYRKKAISKLTMDNFAQQATDRIQEHWNMDMLDFAFGRVYKYDNAGIDSLNFQKAGYGIWINGAKGVGKNGLLTGLLKMNKVGVNRNYMLGASYRFGNYKYNFFAELVRTKMNNIEDNGFLEEEQFANLRADDIGSAWYQFAEGDESNVTWTMSYGGDFKLSRNILLNFALRTELKGDFSFTRFLPVANIICLMN